MSEAVHIFVPVFYDVESFLLLREKILKLLPDAHLHVLDDSSGRDPALAKLKGVRVHRMPENLGHQRALVTGLREFLSEEKIDCLIVTMDGDGEDRPEDLPALFEAYKKLSPAKPVVLARRTSREETPVFKFFYFFYKIFFRVFTGTLIQTGNFALYHSSSARQILFHPYFNYVYASSLFALGAPLEYVPCPRGSRYLGQSKMSFSRLALHGLRMLIPFKGKIALRLGLLLILIAALFTFLLVSRGPVSILAIGESTTFLGGENGWPGILEKKLQASCGKHIRVSKFAIPGSDTYDMAVRIPAGLSIFKPDLVVSMLGINDYENTTKEVDADTRAIFSKGYRTEEELNDAIFQTILERDPWRDRRYSFLFSRYYRDHLQYEEGIRRNQEVLKKWPGHPWALSELGAHLRYSNNSGRAEALHRQAIAAEPKNLGFRLELLGDLLHRDKEFEIAYRDASNVLADSRPLDFFAAGRLQGRGDWEGHLRLMRKITGDGCRTRKCLIMLRTSLEKNGLLKEAENLVLPESEPFLPVTEKNYRSVIKDIKESGAALFLMQYPLRSLSMLQGFPNVDGWISNEEIFRNAGRYEELFADRFAGDFGHFTPKSSEMVADAAAKSLLPWLKGKFRCGVF